MKLNFHFILSQIVQKLAPPYLLPERFYQKIQKMTMKRIVDKNIKDS